MAQVKFKINRRTLTACLAGEIDHHSSQQLRELIDAEVLSQTPEKLVLDFRGVTFMDSSGVGRLTIQNPPMQIVRILRLAQISVENTGEEVLV